MVIAFRLCREHAFNGCWGLRLEWKSMRLKQHGIHLNYTETELEKDMATLKRLREH
jgi:hypothetical protein